MSTGVASASSSPSAGSVWLHGRSSDLLLGYGAAYLVAVPLLLAISFQAGGSPVPAWIYSALGLALVTPHYGATALRVYEERQERRRYAFFAVGVTGALLLLFVVSLYDRFLGSLLFTAYVTWSPWHFSGQNYGLAVMFLRRSGVEVGPELKRPLYASFVLSAALAIAAIHIANSDKLFAQASDYAGTFQVLQLGIPPALGMLVGALLAAAYAIAIAVFARRLARQPSRVRAAPLVLLACTQALWFAVPSAAIASGAPQIGQLLPFAAVVVSVAHSAQYLWVTSYYARLGRGSTKTMSFLAKATLAGAALYVPGFLFMPGLLGPSVPNGTGVLLLAFSVMNLHHFVLDGAIWKLRDGRVARALLRSQAVDPAAASPEPSRHWLRPVMWAVGLGGVLVNFQVIGLELLSDYASDLSTLQGATRQLAFLGKDTPERWGKLGLDLEAAGDPDGAIEAYRAALEKQDPDEPLIAFRLAHLLIEQDDPASLEEATGLASYLADSLGSASASGFRTLAAAHAAAGRYVEAAEASRSGLEIAVANGSAARAQKIRSEVAGYEALAEQREGASP